MVNGEKGQKKKKGEGSMEQGAKKSPAGGEALGYLFY
jgi:hypothetical protein